MVIGVRRGAAAEDLAGSRLMADGPGESGKLMTSRDNMQWADVFDEERFRTVSQAQACGTSRVDPIARIDCLPVDVEVNNIAFGAGC